MQGGHNELKAVIILSGVGGLSCHSKLQSVTCVIMLEQVGRIGSYLVRYVPVRSIRIFFWNAI